MSRDRPKVICLTPVRNEAWILDRFLKCASLWADHVIIADQNSTDGSREIAARYSKVTLVANPFPFSEEKRQKLLLERARQIDGPRLLLALDADEIFTANLLTSPEWDTLLAVRPGTVVQIRLANLKPDLRAYWSPAWYGDFGFMDDGSDHIGRAIHSHRLPPTNGPTLAMRDILVMHLQYTDWERSRSKHRWYQCWERINCPKRSAIDIFRTYHHMYGVGSENLQRIPDAWIQGYRDRGIDMTSTLHDGEYYWDREVLDFFAQYGASYFAKEYVWDLDWPKMAQSYGYDQFEKYRDPRSAVQKMIHSWLLRTQEKANTRGIRTIDKLLQGLGW